MTSFPDEYKLGTCVRCHRFDTRAPNRDIIGVQGNISSLIGWHLGKWSTHVWCQGNQKWAAAGNNVTEAKAFKHLTNAT